MSADPASNPYSASAVNEEPPSLSRLWSVSSGRLMVHDGARLPRTDLMGDDPDVIPVTRAKGNTILRAVIIYLVAIALGMFIREQFHLSSLQFLLTLLLLFFGIARLLTVFFKASRIQFRYYASRKLVIRQGRAYLLLFRLCYLGAVSIFVWILNAKRGIPDVERYIGGAFLLAIVPSLVLRFTYKPWVSTPSGGWAAVDRTDPGAIRRLQALEQAENSAAARQPLLVYGAFVYRYPLRCLANRHWLNPLTALATLLFISKNRNVLVEVPIDPEFSMLPLEDIPPFIANLATPWLNGAYGVEWQLVSFQRQALAAGRVQSEVLRFLSPDRQHAAVLTIATQVPGLRVFQVPSFSFHTRLNDETTVATMRTPHPVPIPGWEVHTTFRGPKAAWQNHLRSLHGRTLAAAVSLQEWREREHATSDSLREAGIAAGIFTPVHETAVLN